MNIFKNRPLCLATVFFVLTGFLCLFLPFVLKMILGGVLLVAAAVLLFVFLKRKHSLSTVVLIALCAVQCFVSCLSVNLPLMRISSYDQAAVRTDAYVCEVLSENNGYYIYKIKTQTIDGNKSSHTLSLSCYEKMEVGQEFTADILILPYDEKSLVASGFAFSSGIAGEAMLDSEIELRGTKNTPTTLATKCRSFLAGCLDNMFSPDTSALLRAMLLGDRSGLSPQTSLSFNRAGVTHLLALSGMHISLLALAVLRVLGFLKVPSKPKSAITIAFVLLYSLLVGMPLSILRAAGMMCILLIGGLIRRERDAITSLCGSVLLILLFSPRAIMDVGFWLSVSATLGILLASEYKIGYVKGHGIGFRILRILLAPLVMTVSASLFTLPITTFIFGNISLLSLPANLIFPGILNYIIYLGLIAIPLPFLRPLVNLAAHGYLWALDRITHCRGIILSLESTTFRVLLVATIIVFLIFIIAKLRHPRRMLIPIGILGFAAVIAVSIPHITTLRDVSLTYSSYADDNRDHLLIRSQGHTLVYASSDYNGISAHMLALELLENDIHEIDVLYLPHYQSGTQSYLTTLSSRILVFEVVVQTPHYTETALADEITNVCHVLDIPLRQVPVDAPVTCDDIVLTALPRSSAVDEEAHVRTSATIRLGKHTFYYASAGYYQAMPREETYARLESLSCDILLFGSHGTSYEQRLPLVYPFDEHVKILVYPSLDIGIVLTEEDKIYYNEVKKTPLREGLKFLCK